MKVMYTAEQMRAYADEHGREQKRVIEAQAAELGRLSVLMNLAAERDRALCGELDECRDALMLARDALDRLMGDTDLDDDDSLEMRAMRAIDRALRAELARVEGGNG
jgi:hypothetical protein